MQWLRNTLEALSGSFYGFSHIFPLPPCSYTSMHTQWEMQGQILIRLLLILHTQNSLFALFYFRNFTHKSLLNPLGSSLQTLPNKSCATEDLRPQEWLLARFRAESLKTQAPARLWPVSLPGGVVLCCYYRITAVPFILDTVDCIAGTVLTNHLHLSQAGFPFGYSLYKALTGGMEQEEKG